MEQMIQAEIAQIIGLQAIQIATLKAQIASLHASLPVTSPGKSRKPHGKSI